MSEKFSDSMEVAEVGDLRPSSIGNDGDDLMRGVLINGVTPEAAKMLYKKCEVVPAGTMMEIETLKIEIQALREKNAVMIEALEGGADSLANGGACPATPHGTQAVQLRAASRCLSIAGSAVLDGLTRTRCAGHGSRLAVNWLK